MPFGSTGQITLCTLRTTLTTQSKGPRTQNGVLSFNYGSGRWLVADLKVVP
jgi:hypothetical protein